jgi:hypothetical protein
LKHNRRGGGGWGEVVPTAGDGAGGATEVVAATGRSTMGASMGTVDRPTGEEDCKVNECSE